MTDWSAGLRCSILGSGKQLWSTSLLADRHRSLLRGIKQLEREASHFSLSIYIILVAALRLGAYPALNTILISSSFYQQPEWGTFLKLMCWVRHRPPVLTVS
jgi:hypothetical protein